MINKCDTVITIGKKNYLLRYRTYIEELNFVISALNDYCIKKYKEYYEITELMSTGRFFFVRTSTKTGRQYALDILKYSNCYIEMLHLLIDFICFSKFKRISFDEYLSRSSNEEEKKELLNNLIKFDNVEH